MKIVICASISSTPVIAGILPELEKKGIECDIPYTSSLIIEGELTMEEFLREKKEKGDGAFRKVQSDAIKNHYKKIKEGDAILVVNDNKNGIENYVGPNTFLEIGFAYVLGKPIYLLNPIPSQNHKDEIVAMRPVVLGGDLSGIGEGE